MNDKQLLNVDLIKIKDPKFFSALIKARLK